MTDQFETISFKGGIWQGLLHMSQAPHRLILTHLGETVAQARVTEDGDQRWRVAVAIPAQRLAEGVHSFVLIADEGEGSEPPLPGATRIARLPLFAGTALDQDFLGELDLLKAEVELLKREFRRIALQMPAAPHESTALPEAPAAIADSDHEDSGHEDSGHEDSGSDQDQ